MLKKFSGLLLVIMSLLFVVSCGDKKDAGGTTADGPVTIDIWLTPQWKGVYDAKEEGADYEKNLRRKILILQLMFR